MNPNDHPHGGRTRAIKYPRTPWGKTAKKSRRPSQQLALKPLAKRRLKLKSTAPELSEAALPTQAELS